MDQNLLEMFKKRATSNKILFGGLSLSLFLTLVVVLMLTFLPFGKDVFNQLFPKPPAKAFSLPTTRIPSYVIGGGGREGTESESLAVTNNAVYIGGGLEHPSGGIGDIKFMGPY